MEEVLGSWKGGSKLQGLGERCKLLYSGFGPDCCGRTKSPENVSGGRKCCLIHVSRFDLAEPLDAICGTLRFRGIPVEKQCHRVSNHTCILRKKDMKSFRACPVRTLMMLITGE